MTLTINPVPNTIDCDICGRQIPDTDIYIGLNDETICKQCFIKSKTPSEITWFRELHDTAMCGDDCPFC